MKKKLSALLLSAVLCVTTIPVTGMAAEGSDDTAVGTFEEDAAETSEEISDQDETPDASDDAEEVGIEEKSGTMSIGELEQAQAGSSNSDDFSDSADDFSDGEEFSRKVLSARRRLL